MNNMLCKEPLTINAGQFYRLTYGHLFISLYIIFAYLRCIFSISYHVEFCYLKNRQSLLFKLRLESFSDIDQCFPHFTHKAEVQFLWAVFFLQNVTWCFCKVQRDTKLKTFFWVSSTKSSKQIVVQLIGPTEPGQVPLDLWIQSAKTNF